MTATATQKRTESARPTTSARPATNGAPVRGQVGVERPCACGCGQALTAQQARYATRTCAGRHRMADPVVRAQAVAALRALWADPQKREARVRALRAAKAQERIAHWWAEAHLDEAWIELGRVVDLDALTRRDQLALRVWVARLMAAQTARGYRNGWQSQRRVRVRGGGAA